MDSEPTEQTRDVENGIPVLNRSFPYSALKVLSERLNLFKCLSLVTFSCIIIDASLFYQFLTTIRLIFPMMRITLLVETVSAAPALITPNEFPICRRYPQPVLERTRLRDRPIIRY